MKSLCLFFLIHFSPEVVFNEIMYDPVPSIGLPEYEFVELFNRSSSEIDIGNWALYVGSREIIIPECILRPEEYLLLVYQGTSEQYPGSANKLELLGNKTLLLNQGELLCLYDDEGRLIDWMEYSPDMHTYPYHRAGGWSVERIDPNRFCGESNNWVTSKNTKGGTPGYQNSVFRNNPDHTQPEIIEVFVIDSITMVLIFSEPMLEESLKDLSSYTIENGALNPAMIEIAFPHSKEVIIHLDRALEEGREYWLEISGELSDCNGLAVSSALKYRFALPSEPDPNNLAISEILFDPMPACPEFLELYNCSDKTFDLADIRIGTRDHLTGQIDKVVAPVKRNHLVFPHDYIALSGEADLLQLCYFTGPPSSLIQSTSLNSFDNKKGNILIMDKWLNIIDELYYNDGMHFPLLSSKSGVSLERMSYSFPASDPSNWHSASSLEGFATPGRRNSNHMETHPMKSAIVVEPEVFSPNQDGLRDICFIRFTFDHPGIIISVRIFDSSGRTIKYIAENDLVAMEGFYSWDGTDMNGRRARAGIYLILIETFDIEGMVRQYKETCVLSPGR